MYSCCFQCVQALSPFERLMLKDITGPLLDPLGQIGQQMMYHIQTVSTGTLYTNDCTSRDPSVQLLKFADNKTVICLIQDCDESAYRWDVEQLVLWCGDNNLELIIIKISRDDSGLQEEPPQ